jgi:hypothetical protein
MTATPNRWRPSSASTRRRPSCWREWPRSLRYYIRRLRVSQRVEDPIDVATSTHGLSDQTLANLDELPGEVPLRSRHADLPYARRARLAHRLAIASPRITADVIEANEFPALSDRYHVSGVPQVVINDDHSFVGAQPEARFVAELRRAFVGHTPSASLLASPS